MWLHIKGEGELIVCGMNSQKAIDAVIWSLEGGGPNSCSSLRSGFEGDKLKMWSRHHSANPSTNPLISELQLMKVKNNNI